MSDNRIYQHPILDIKRGEKIKFQWNGKSLFGYRHETIASALIANNIQIFGNHHKDGSPQGIFCANGQCAQCMVLVNGKPEKACCMMLAPGLYIEPLHSLPQIVENKSIYSSFLQTKDITVPVLIIGGGPAGLSAALVLSDYGIRSILVDDKRKLGGKLVLQTHRFFGSRNAVYAGTRGIEIANILEKKVLAKNNIEVWNDSTAIAVFHDKKIGILYKAREYRLISPEVLIMACGAREKTLTFPGNTLPGVIGAGAFQTLLNRDLIKPAKRIVVIGGGNVGLITAYHALQAGIEVGALVELLPECGGYKVHRDKLARLGVPILNSHTLIKAEGVEKVESALIAKVDEQFKPLNHEQISIACDMILIAVGLNPIDELTQQANRFGMRVFAAGDSNHIAEASAAILSGQISGHQVAKFFKKNVVLNLDDLQKTQKILESKPGKMKQNDRPEHIRNIYPVLHCTQEIPCDPCMHLCPVHLIKLEDSDLRSLPCLDPEVKTCTGCLKCVAGCPGLAITVVDKRSDPQFPLVSVASEFKLQKDQIGGLIQAVNNSGETITNVLISDIIDRKANNKTQIIQFRVPAIIADTVAGVRIIENDASLKPANADIDLQDDAIICRCERVTAGEIRKYIFEGIHDLNELKTITRAGMGACGGKTCQALILQLLKEEGVDQSHITAITPRPLFLEVELGIFAGLKDLHEPEGGID